MADHSDIEWTDATWNPITGCSIASPGCSHCYAMKLAGTRLRHHPSRQGLTVESKIGPQWTGEVRLNEKWLTQPLTWARPRRIFVCAHGDLFHENVPDEWIDKVFAIMALAPQHTFQVLTKRAGRMRAYVTARVANNADAVRVMLTAFHAPKGKYCAKLPWPLPNVCLGVSAERQKEADERIPHLQATPAAVRFLSAEPLLGPIDLMEVIPNPIIWSPVHGMSRLLDWVIVGGESGVDARPMHPDWVRSLRDQCQAAGTRFFFKQWGTWAPRAWRLDGGTHAMHRDAPDYGTFQKIQSHPDSIERTSVDDGWQAFAKVGKSAAGRLLDGIEHNDMPKAAI